ncbi:MAG: alpha/beta hydrolase [Pseudomonadota bacterium]
MSAAYRERWIAAEDGSRLAVSDYGDPLAPGTPMLCLAGLTRNAKDYAALAERLAPERRVVCLDYRGRGRSDHAADWRDYRPEVSLRDVIAVVTALNLHPLVILGTSFGGLLAMGLAAFQPSVLAGVILNDVGPEVQGDGKARIRDYIGQDRPQPDWPSAVAELKGLFSQLGFETDDQWRRFAEATYKEGPDGRLHFDWDVTLARAFADDQTNGTDLWQLYRALGEMPVLALRGATSDVLSEATFQRMAELKPDLIRVTVPGVGHTPALDEPISQEAIDDFLAAIDRNRAH